MCRHRFRRCSIELATFIRSGARLVFGGDDVFFSFVEEPACSANILIVVERFPAQHHASRSWDRAFHHFVERKRVKGGNVFKDPDEFVLTFPSQI